jgi:UrcA family protein
MARLFATAACAAALFFAAAAPASAQSQVESRVVAFGDLDLDSPEGADVLIRRIQMAADVVCGDRPGPQGIAERYNIRGCEIQTTEYAINDVGHPMVLGRYYGHTPEVVVEGSWDDDPSYEVIPKY